MVTEKHVDRPAGAPLTVYFDGACPLCSTEIRTYRNCRGGDAIDWVDISNSSGGDVAPGLSHEAALRRFHVRRPDGSISSGGAAFAELWAALPAFAWAGRLGRRRPFAWVLERAYRAFLPMRPHLQRWMSRLPRNARNGSGGA